MVSDVPVGSLLSGGLDSSLITAIAARKHEQSFQCFTINYPDPDNILDGADKDAPHARRFCQEHSLGLHEILLHPQMTDLLPQLIYHLDEPLADPAAIASYLICKLAEREGDQGASFRTGWG